MIGKQYLDPGDRFARHDPPELVTVLARWNPEPAPEPPTIPGLTLLLGAMSRSGPRNVLVARPDGSHCVLPFSRRLRLLAV